MISSKKSIDKLTIDNMFSKSNSNKSNISYSNLLSNSNKNIQENINNYDKDKILNIGKILGYIIIVIIILAIIGINLFHGLGDSIDYISNLLKPISGMFAFFTGETLKTTIDNTTSGTNTILSGVSNTASNIIDTANKGSTNIINTSGDYTNFGISKLQDKLNNKNIVNPENNEEYVENSDIYHIDETVKNKQLEEGYCYIGSQGSKRYCAKVDSSTKCMSGDIYPSLDICINPRLR